MCHMPLSKSTYPDHNERYDPEKGGGIQQKFATTHRQDWSSINSIVTPSESNCTVVHSCSEG